MMRRMGKGGVYAGTMGTAERDCLLPSASHTVGWGERSESGERSELQEGMEAASEAIEDCLARTNGV